MTMSMQHWWNGTGTAKQKYWEKILCQCHYVHHKSETDWREFEGQPYGEPYGEWQPPAAEPWHGLFKDPD
jgi:hypothetical protein